VEERRRDSLPANHYMTRFTIEFKLHDLFKDCELDYAAPEVLKLGRIVLAKYLLQSIVPQLLEAERVQDDEMKDHLLADAVTGTSFVPEVAVYYE
jgi:hypothetical protein